MRYVATVTRVGFSEGRFGLSLRFATRRPQFISDMDKESVLK
jgi:hypothetical protein